MIRNRRRGSALIEAAAVLPVMALVVCASIDLGRTLQLSQVAAAAARAGVHRALSQDPHTVDLKMIEDAALADAGISGFTATATRVCSCGTQAATNQCDAVKCNTSRWSYIQVDTRLELKPMIRYPWLSSPPFVHGQAVMRVE